MKKLFTVLLVAMAIAGLALAVKNRIAEPVPPEPVAQRPPTVPETAAAAHVVKVTYFTTNVRCPSCLKIEELTRKIVETRFAGELTEGTVTFQLINTDLPGNAHFIEDYGLVSKTVVVAEFDEGVPGDWINLQDVWLKFTDPESFEQYITDAVNGML